MLAIQKRVGYGSFSLVLLLAGFLMNWNFESGLIISHSLFKIIGLDLYSNGTDGFNYPILASIPFWLAAVLVSRRFANDFGATISNRIGEFLLAISVIATIFFLLVSLFSS